MNERIIGNIEELGYVSRRVERRALLIAVDEYEDEGINDLKYAEGDAVRVSQLFSKLGFSRAKPLLGRNATSKNIKRTLRELREDLPPGSLLVIYFSGHGVLDHNKLPHLLLHDAVDQGSSWSGTMPLAWLTREARGDGHHHRLFLFDACRTTTDANKGGSQPRFQGGTQYRNLGEPEGASPGCQVIINSCEDDSAALELDRYQQGVFSKALVDVAEEWLAAGRDLLVGQEFVNAVGERMDQLVAEAGRRATGQHPMLIAGRFPVTLDGKEVYGSTGYTEHFKRPTTKVRALPRRNLRLIAGSLVALGAVTGACLYFNWHPAGLAPGLAPPGSGGVPANLPSAPRAASLGPEHPASAAAASAPTPPVPTNPSASRPAPAPGPLPAATVQTPAPARRSATAGTAAPVTIAWEIPEQAKASAELAGLRGELARVLRQKSVTLLSSGEAPYRLATRIHVPEAARNLQNTAAEEIVLEGELVMAATNAELPWQAGFKIYRRPGNPALPLTLDEVKVLAAKAADAILQALGESRPDSP